MTSIVAVAMLSGLPAPAPDLAFVARFYYQGKRKSNYQIYVANFDGSRRRQLTFGNIDLDEAVWVDSRHVAYTVATNSRQLKETYVSDIVVRVIDSVSGQDRKIAEYKAATLGRVGRKVAVTKSGVTKWYEMSATRMKPIPQFKEDPFEDFGYVESKPGDPENPSPRKVTVSTTGGTQSFNWMFDYERLEYEPGEIVAVSGDRVGNKFDVNLLGHDVKDIQRDSQATYLITGPAFTKFDYPSFVYRWADDAEQPKLIASKVGRIDFRADRDYWFGDDVEQRRLLPLKDGRVVYVNSLYCGNWKTGKRWTIATGLVSVYGASVRPKA